MRHSEEDWTVYFFRWRVIRFVVSWTAAISILLLGEPDLLDAIIARVHP